MMTTYGNLMRAVAIAAVCGSLALAGCGGGGHSVLPGPASAGQSGTPITAKSNAPANATLSIAGLPVHTSSSATRVAAIAATSRSPQYLDTTSANSAIVVSVSPQDPAEAAQYGNLTVCYNLYTNGTLNAAIAAGSPPVVTISFPAPPGTDGFQVTQYLGQCGSSQYTLPVEPAGTANNGILSQTPVAYAYLAPGATSNINTQIAACTQPATAPTQSNPYTCVGPGGGTGALIASVSVASIAFGTVPIPSPVREQGGFLAPGTNTIGVPIPLEGLNAAGTVVPGLTTPLNLTGGAGPFPSGVTVTLQENVGGTVGNPAHAKLYLVDAANGLVAQAGSGATQQIVIHEFNAISDGTITGVPADNTSGDPAGGGHPWVLVMTYDGTGASKITSETVTATATINSVVQTITTTIAPQSAVYTAGTAPTGYADTAVYTAPVGLLQNAGNVYVTDGPSVKIDGTNTASTATTASVPAATVTSLTGLTFAAWPSPATPVAPFVYAVDNGQAGGSSATEIASGLYAYATTPAAPVPVAAQAGSGNYVQFSNPVGVVQAQGPVSGKYYLFVIDKTGAIFRVDIANNGAVDGNGFQVASNVSPAIVTSGTALKPGTATYLATAPIGTAGQFLVADPGNNRIAQVDATQSPAVISTFASGQAFTGLFVSGSAVYATTTGGQVYYISGSGATPVSLGFATSATTVTDGPIGQLPSLTPTTAPTLTPTNYALQFQANSFFSTTASASGTFGAPYTVAPFANGSTGPVFTVAPAGIGLAADTSAGATTGKGTVNATGGIVVFPSTAAASAVVTPGSILFVDTTNKKLRTIVQ